MKKIKSLTNVNTLSKLFTILHLVFYVKQEHPNIFKQIIQQNLKS
jgi:hypothetical protein